MSEVYEIYISWLNKGAEHKAILYMEYGLEDSETVDSVKKALYNEFGQLDFEEEFIKKVTHDSSNVNVLNVRHVDNVPMNIKGLLPFGVSIRQPKDKLNVILQRTIKTMTVTGIVSLLLLVLFL